MQFMDANPETNLSRRSLLKAVAVSGGLMLGVEAWGQNESRTAQAGAAVNAFIRIDKDDAVTIVVPRIEMGQATYTALPLLVAEELEVDPARLKLDHAPPNEKIYGGGGLQLTGGSNAVRTFWRSLREAGAAARLMLVQAAAATWGVSTETCRAQNGAVIHLPSGRQLRYGTIAEQAARLPVPTNIGLKPARLFKLIGGNQRRLDAREKVNGQAKYGVDVSAPGMGIAVLAQSPVPGGRVRSVNTAAALAIRGVRQVVQLDDLVAVVADHTGAARKGLAAAAVQWDGGANGGFSSERMVQEMVETSKGPGATARSEGDVAAARVRAAKVLEATYQQPLLAHAAMEPLSCTVHVTPGGCELWLGIQSPPRAQTAAAAVLGIPADKVTVHGHLLGGAFGRRLEADFVTQATRVGREVKGPVKVMWTREEDMQHDLYRPAHFNRLAATLDAQGRPISWEHRVTGSSIFARRAPAAFKGVDADAIRDAAGPYDFGNVLVQYVRHEAGGHPTGFWRGIGHTQNAFPVESFLDELAHAAGKDAVEFRMPLLDKHPRARQVLRIAAEKAGWGRPLAKGKGRGIALTFSFGSYAAQAMEVTVDDKGEVKVDRVVTAVDCGVAVSPPNIVAQMESGTIYGLSAALYGEISISNGRVVQSNFHDYRVIRINEAPRFETHIVPSEEAPTGVGEVATVLTAPALVNAIHAATGVRVRQLPVARPTA